MAESSNSEMSDAESSESGCFCAYHDGKWMTCPACVKEMHDQCKLLKEEKAKVDTLYLEVLKEEKQFIGRIQRAYRDK